MWDFNCDKCNTCLTKLHGWLSYGSTITPLHTWQQDGRHNIFPFLFRRKSDLLPGFSCLNKEEHFKTILYGNSFLKLYWATPFEIHTPPVEDFGKVYRRWECEFSNAPIFCIIFRLGLLQRVFIFYSEKPNELLYLKFRFPLSEMFLKSSTGVCGIRMELPIEVASQEELLYSVVKGQRYIASVCHTISLIEFRKPFTQSKCINCIGIQNNNILKKLFHTFIQTVILKLVMLNYG